MSSTRSRSAAVPTLLAASLLTVSSSLVGCNIVGPAVAIVQGPPTTQAQFELPEGKSVVFFIDDRSNALRRRSLRQVIAEQAQTSLLAKQKDRRVIDARAAVAVASRETATEPMDSVTIGRMVKADLMIYVTMDAFSLTPDGVNFLPAAIARIKVLDTARDTDPRLWPAEAEGFTLKVAPNQRAAPLPQSSAEYAKAEAAFAATVGDAVAKVFFKHETREAINPSN